MADVHGSSAPARPTGTGSPPSSPPPPLAVDLAALDPASPVVRTFTGPFADAAQANTPEWRRADMGATNGHSNARGVLQVMRTMTLGGEAGGVRLLSEKTIDRAFELQADGVDLVLGVPFSYVMNRMARGIVGSGRSEAYVRAVYEGLG
jgi:hypothetical protein